MDRIDLHIHSNASDGTDDPAAIIEKGAALGLRAMSITDHDSVAGVEEAVAAGERLGVEVIPGIELSSDYRDNNVHILGYFIDIHAPAMREALDWIAREWEERNRRPTEMFVADGIDMTMEALEAEYPGSVIGRPHMAEFLMRRGYTRCVKESFDKYLGEDRKYFLPKRRPSFARAVEVILASGGVPVLAHPLQYRYPQNEVIEMIEYARACGIRALECYYSEHSPEDQAWLLSRAEHYGLGVSGGSDFHGTRKTHIALGTGMGDLAVPYSVLENLKALRD